MSFSLQKALLTALVLVPLFAPDSAFATVESTKISLSAKRISEHLLTVPATGIALSLGETAGVVELQMK